MIELTPAQIQSIAEETVNRYELALGQMADYPDDVKLARLAGTIIDVLAEVPGYWAGAAGPDGQPPWEPQLEFLGDGTLTPAEHSKRLDRFLEMFRDDLDTLVNEHPGILLELSGSQAWALLCQVQLACRHPGNTGWSRDTAELLARKLEIALAITPGLKRMAALGWDARYDAPLDETDEGGGATPPPNSSWASLSSSARLCPHRRARIVTGKPYCDLQIGTEVWVLETNIDDTSPEVIGYCMERLMAAGALDVYAVPIHMKKWRTGVLLGVLCDLAQAPALERILFLETTTFGVRRHAVRRTKMKRRVASVTTPYGDIRMKIGKWSDIASAVPEYDDCRAAAEKHGVAVRKVMAAAQSSWTDAGGVR